MELEKRYRAKANMPVRFSSSFSDIFGTLGSSNKIFCHVSMQGLFRLKFYGSDILLTEREEPK